MPASFPTFRENQARTTKAAAEDNPPVEPKEKQDPKAEPAEKPAKQPKAEDLSGLTAFVNRGMRGLSSPPAEKPEKGDKAETKKPKEQEKPEKPAKPAPFKPKLPAKPPVETPPAPQLTAADIASATAKAVAEAMKPVEKESTTKPAGQPLSASEQKKVSVLKKMEELNPEQYKGISDRYETSIRALQEYASQWEENHPGQEFDEDAPEHADFFRKNDIDWSDDDYEDARIRVAAEKLVDERMKGPQKELADLRQKEQLRESASKIGEAQNDAARGFWSKFGEDFGDIIDESGKVNGEKLAKFNDSDPIGQELRIAAATTLDVEVAEVYKLYNGLVEKDQNNPVHRDVIQFIVSMEKKLSERPIQERSDGQGRDFVPATKYWNMTKAERERHWTFTENDVKHMRAANLAALTLERIKVENAKYERWQKSRKPAAETVEEPVRPAANAIQEPAEEVEEEPVEPVGKPKSPSDSGGPKVAPMRGGPGESASTAVRSFTNKFLGIK